MNIDLQRNRVVHSSSSSNLNEFMCSIGKVNEIDLYSPLELYLKGDPEWIISINPAAETNSNLVYTYKEIKSVLDYFSADFSKNSWYHQTSDGIYVDQCPTHIHFPKEYISNISYYEESLPFVPVRVNGFSECAVCGSSSECGQSYRFFGTGISLHKECLCGVIATLQNLLLDIDPVIVSKTI